MLPSSLRLKSPQQWHQCVLQNLVHPAKNGATYQIKTMKLKPVKLVNHTILVGIGMEAHVI